MEFRRRIRSPLAPWPSFCSALRLLRVTSPLAGPCASIRWSPCAMNSSVLPFIRIPQIVEAYMPNLENLKKQAKLIMRWHRERHYPVAAQIRGHLPRFLNMPDSEILAASFKLSDAQEMVSRQQGFDSWQALKAGLSTTSPKVKSSPSKATIVSAEPQLFVTDIKRSC